MWKGVSGRGRKEAYPYFIHINGPLKCTLHEPLTKLFCSSILANQKMSTQACITFIGPLNSIANQSETLAFISKYAARVDSGDLSGPFHDWYAPSAQFYNADGVQKYGGAAIWDWMRALFGQFERIEHDMKITRILPYVSEKESENGKTGELVLFDCVTTFWISGPLAGDGVAIPRMLSFLVGEAEEDGQGTDGLQILEAKAWWDTGVLGKEIARRKGVVEQKE
jgi:hypothetical protein